MSIFAEMAIADGLRAGRETPDALMTAIAADLNGEAEAAGWPGMQIVRLDYEAGDVVIVVEPGKGRLSIERMRAWLGKSKREARAKAAKADKGGMAG